MSQQAQLCGRKPLYKQASIGASFPLGSPSLFDALLETCFPGPAGRLPCFRADGYDKMARGTMRREAIDAPQVKCA